VLQNNSSRRALGFEMAEYCKSPEENKLKAEYLFNKYDKLVNSKSKRMK